MGMFNPDKDEEKFFGDLYLRCQKQEAKEHKTMDAPDQYQINAKFYASSFQGVKLITQQILTTITAASNLNQIPRVEGGGGSGGGSGGYSVTVTSPIKERIKALREEADRLEAELWEK